MTFKWLTSAFSSSASKKPEDMNYEEARPAFFKAIKAENMETLTAISRKFPDALGWENENGNALYIALAQKKLGAFRHLITLGADMNGDAPGGGWCLLQQAAYDGKKEFVQYMLEQGVSKIGEAEYWARDKRNFDIADMIKRKDIIRAEYLAANPQTAPAAAAADMATDAKIGVLSPVQLRKTPDSAPT